MQIELNTQSINNLLQKPKEEFNKKFEKISTVAKKIFKLLKTIVTYPLRLLGSKTFSIPGLLFRFPVVLFNHILKRNDPDRSFTNDLFNNQGYHRFDHQNLTPEEARDNIIYSCAAAAVQRNKHLWLDPFGYKLISTKGHEAGLEIRDSNLIDPKSGLKIGAYEKDNKDPDNGGEIFFDSGTGLKIGVYENEKDNSLLIVFGAFGSHATQYDLNDENSKKESNAVNNSIILNSLSTLFGTQPTLFKKANKFVEALKKSEKFQNKKITLTGQSLGGTIASYVSLRQEIPAVSLNAGPLGAGLQKKIGDKNLQKADNLVTHVIAKGDLFANTPIIVRVADMAISALGVRTPGNFGKKMHVPTLYKGIIDIHYHILGALFARAFSEHTDVCKNIASTDKQVCKDSMKTLTGLIDKEFNRN